MIMNLVCLGSADLLPAKEKSKPKAKAAKMAKPRRPDPKDYQFSNLQNQVLRKEPGQIAGLDFTLQKLSSCEVYLLDHSVQVMADDIKDCKLVLGPIDGSAFLRQCTGCTIYVACRQFRCREMFDCDVYLFCATKSPVFLPHHALLA